MRGFCLFVWLLSAFATSVDSQPSTRSVRDGVYNKEQADRGATLFDERCASCHTRDAFSGRYLYPWAGQSADKLFETMRSSMPEDDPGGLSREQNADLLAFIFSRNGFPPGARELDSAPAALKAILIEMPAPAK